jgi:hypothetical protein
MLLHNLNILIIFKIENSESKDKISIIIINCKI